MALSCVSLTRQNVLRAWRLCRRGAGSLHVVDRSEMDAMCRTGRSAFSECIDVRTAEEFEKDHLPGAVNIPILDFKERQVVGEQYANNQFGARRLGASMVCRHLSRHLGPDGYFASKDDAYRPLFYCARGGMRSRSVAETLQHVGFHVGVLEGGYKAYRAWVRQQLSELPGSLRLFVISGLTGSGKSRLLELIGHRGEQILHLEDLAKHKGSLLGLYPGVDRTPPQRTFDSQLARTLLSFGPERPVWVECESRIVGNSALPDALWFRMKDAPRLLIEAETKSRVEYIMKDYEYLVQDVETLNTRLAWIATLHSEEVLTHWRRLVANGDFRGLVEDLLWRHYDPLYTRSRRQYVECADPDRVQRVRVESLVDEEYLEKEVIPDLMQRGYGFLTR